MGRRTKARECALQMLYQSEIGKRGMEAVARAFWRVRTATPETRGAAERLAYGASRELGAIDEEIKGASRNWRFERLAAVDRNVLRLAAYELMHEPGVPTAVVIDEAVEIAKRFGAEESAGFVNGVLDAVAREVRDGGKGGGEE